MDTISNEGHTHEHVHEQESATPHNHENREDRSSYTVIYLILFLVLLFVLFYFGLPILRSFSAINQGPEINVPPRVDINVNQNPEQPPQ